MFFVSFASKERRIQINDLEPTLASISISGDSKWVSLAVSLSSGEARVRQGGAWSVR